MFQNILERIPEPDFRCPLDVWVIDCLWQLARDYWRGYDVAMTGLPQNIAFSFVKVGGGEVGTEWPEVFDQFDDRHLVEVLVFHDTLLADIGRPPAEFGEDEVVSSVGEFLFHEW